MSSCARRQVAAGPAWLHLVGSFWCSIPAPPSVMQHPPFLPPTSPVSAAVSAPVLLWLKESVDGAHTCTRPPCPFSALPCQLASFGQHAVPAVPATCSGACVTPPKQISRRGACLLMAHVQLAAPLHRCTAAAAAAAAAPTQFQHNLLKGWVPEFCFEGMGFYITHHATGSINKRIKTCSPACLGAVWRRVGCTGTSMARMGSERAAPPRRYVLCL